MGILRFYGYSCMMSLSDTKTYNDMQQKIERLQAQLGDPKGKSKDTSCVSDTLDPLPKKLENENVELEYQSAFLTQGTISNIPIIFSWSDNIRPEGFLSSVLLWLVIIVAVVGVDVTVVVVIESSSVVKLSLLIT
ncbi:hypothetical protein Tco_1082352 [Tanacetum coccineum]|uniref:Uncharacterized protein n=1 Tax=Tanacetum coccineum TaxID=301880 RepID=A0ABQ5I1U8_9ASTR